ncbi:hypothetical protein AgCh_034280 [Apium graveolens]
MYPGKVPNLDLMFDCVDWPGVRSRFYRGPNATAPPPLVRYFADDSTLDIVFPEWMDLLKCNVSEKQDWNARVYAQFRTVDL